MIVGLSLIILGAAILASGWVDSLLLSVISLWRGRPPAADWPGKLNLFAVEALVSGLAVAVLGWLVLPRWTPVASRAEKDSVLAAVSVLGIILLWLPVVLVGHSAIFAGERVWWLNDDAMISMKYARNLANGFGLVWNPGEKVEGYTNFLWTIYMAFVHLFPIAASKTSLVILLTNIVLAIITIPVIVRLIRLLGGGTWVTAATLAGYVLNRNVMAWATAGLETTLLTLLFLLAMYRVLREAQLGQPNLLTFLLIAILSLVRADAAVLSVLLYALSVLLNKNRKLVVIYAATSLLLPIGHEVFRYLYYGDVLPNTAYLKTLGWNGRTVAGLAYVRAFVKRYFILIGCAVLGSLCSRQRPRLALLGVLGVYVAYVAYVGGDAFADFRFFVPILPLLWILASLAVQSWEFAPLVRRFVALGQLFSSGAIRLAQTMAGATMVLVSLTADLIGWGAKAGFGTGQLLGVILGGALLMGSWAFPGLWRNKQTISLAVVRFVPRAWLQLALSLLCLVATPLLIPGRIWFLHASAADTGNIRIGLLLRQNTSPQSTVADFWAGSVFYFSERIGIDLLGKSDRYVAHLPVTSSGTVPGHNKFDFDYSLGVLKPDFVVANFRLPVQEDQMLLAATGDWAYTGQLFLNSVFREHCLPNPIVVDTWRTVFVCDWSPEIKNKDGWQE